MNWTQLFECAEQMIDEVLVEARAQRQPLLLQPSTRSGSLLLLAVGCLWPFEVILDEKNLLQDEDSFRLDESKIPSRLLPAAAWIQSDAEAPRLGFRWEDWQLTLCTSGSTGEPKRIRKSGAGLLAEVHDLAELYQWTAQDAVLSLVSPLHIYGLLHSFLLPLYTRSTVEFVSFQEGPVDPACLQYQSYAGVIGVPATWSFVKDLLACKSLGTLVMSGAPFGESRRRELQALPQKPQSAWEILGSTETGGLGFRSLLQRDDSFRCLKSVRIFERDGRQWVESPYLQPETVWELADRLELQADGRFLHQGRSDRIFKYAGQRYALMEVEKSLSL
ncbi:MAG: AMP-binding protein, partial [Pseudobdellovibrionaceae bacterium]|nr:AMP-binding protein [Pseudobdellovibrionaceae bacterium]